MLLNCAGLQWGTPGRPLTPPLDFQLEAGSLTALIGANGSGKSSLLKVIAGWQEPLAGTLTLEVPELGGIGYLLQQPMLDRQFPIDLAGLVGAGLWRSALPHRTRRLRLRQALEAWRLEGLENRPLVALSGGELQRALLARLGLTEARLLLLDEPEVSLDELGRALLWQRIAAWRQTGRTILVATHDLTAVHSHTDDCLWIDSEGCTFGYSRRIALSRRMGQVA
ncbi:metal ABC transporter ATP-binding protein [Azotobacter armeniacus]